MAVSRVSEKVTDLFPLPPIVQPSDLDRMPRQPPPRESLDIAVEHWLPRDRAMKGTPEHLPHNLPLRQCQSNHGVGPHQNPVAEF